MVVHYFSYTFLFIWNCILIVLFESLFNFFCVHSIFWLYNNFENLLEELINNFITFTKAIASELGDKFDAEVAVIFEGRFKHLLKLF